MKRSARLMHLGWMVLGLVLLTEPARADVLQDAATHFEQGVRLVDSGRLREALDEFQLAYQLSPNPAVLYNIGQALADLGRPSEAIDALGRYLKDSGDSIAPPRRSEVERQLADLEGKTAFVTVEVDAAGALVRLDDREIGTSPLGAPVRVDAGTHVFSASRQGRAPDRQTLRVQGGKPSLVRLSLAEQRAAPEPAARPATSPTLYPAVPAQGRSRGRGALQRELGMAAGAIGLVGFGVGTFFALRSRSKDQQSDRHCGAAIDQPEGACDPTGLALNQDAMDASTVAIIGFVVGGAATLGGVTLYVTAPSADAAPASSASLLRRGWFGLPGLGARGYF